MKEIIKLVFHFDNENHKMSVEKWTDPRIDDETVILALSEYIQQLKGGKK